MFTKVSLRLRQRQTAHIPGGLLPHFLGLSPTTLAAKLEAIAARFRHGVSRRASRGARKR